MIPLTGPILTSEVNTTVGRSSNTLFRVEDATVRALAGKTTVGSLVKWSDFRGKALAKYFGMTKNFYWAGAGEGNYINLSDYFPGISAGMTFSTIVGMGPPGWAGGNAGTTIGSYFVYPLYEFVYTYGTARTATFLSGFSIGSGSGKFKGSWGEGIYDGSNSFHNRGYYYGGSTNFPTGTCYLMGLKLIPDVDADTALINYTIESFAASYPPN